MNIPYDEMPRKIEELLGDIEKLEQEKKIVEEKYKKAKSILDEIKTHIEEYGTGELKFVFGICILKILDKMNDER